MMTIIAKVFPGALPRKSIGSIPILVSKELIRPTWSAVGSPMK